MDDQDERALQPVAEVVSGLADIIGQVGQPEQGQVLTVQDLRVELPLELVVETDQDGALVVLTAPPERTETSFMPALGSLSIRVVLEEGES